MKKISIILPVYNAHDFLQKMLDSILSQTIRDFELIVINDASIDGSDKTIEEFAATLPSNFSIHIINNLKNVGLTESINIGFKTASSHYLALADHDDIWFPDKLEQQMNFMDNQKDFSCCLCNRMLINEEDKIILKSEYRLRKFKVKTTCLNDLIKQKTRRSSNTMFFRNVGFENLKIPSNVIEHDLFLVLKLASYGRIKYIHQPLVKYRIHKNNLSGNYNYLINYSYADFKKSLLYDKTRKRQIIQNDLGIMKSLLPDSRASNYFSRRYREKKKNTLTSYVKFVIIRNIKRMIINLLN